MSPTAKICFGGGELLGDKSRSYASYTELLFRHSLVPYHVEFWCNEDRTNFFAGGAPLSKYLKNYFLKQIRFFNNSCPTLRMCKSCVGLEIEFLGTSFWHRKHQLPGVVCCHIHNCTLYKSEIPNKFDYRLQNLKLPHQTKNLTRVIEYSSREFCLALALNSEVLLDTIKNDLEPKNNHWRQRSSEEYFLSGPHTAKERVKWIRSKYKRHLANHFLTFNRISIPPPANPSLRASMESEDHSTLSHLVLKTILQIMD